MIPDLDKILQDARAALDRAGSPDDVENVRVEYLGRKGEITNILRSIGSYPPEERPEIGKNCNRVKNQLTGDIEQKKEELKGQTSGRERIDLTVPGRDIPYGTLHPLTIVERECIEFFSFYGFQVVEGPEVETEYYNFESLNFPADHPARDMQDTLYLDNGVLLRTHTSPVQTRTMEKHQPPIRIVAPGRVFRSDTVDASHSPVFHQIEGLLIDDRATFSDLKGILAKYVEHVFGEGTEVRFRPSFFPFTEPSAEVDMVCFGCEGEGCSVCGEGYLEILGAGMVDPAVLEYAGYDTKKYQGFAFGMGLERIAMLKYGIHNMRYLFENDIRFLEQFAQ